MQRTPPLAIPELAQLLVRLEYAIAHTARAFTVGMTAIMGLFVMMAVVYGLVLRLWSVAGFVALVGGVIMFIGRAAARKTAPARMQPVMDAVRDAPDQVVSVRHYTTSDSRGLFVSHWLEVKTADHRLVMKAQDDWAELLGYLARRCPTATITAA